MARLFVQGDSRSRRSASRGFFGRCERGTEIPVLKNAMFPEAGPVAGRRACDIVPGRRRTQSFALPHAGFQQRFAGERFVFHRQMIFLHFALSVEGSENLFFAGPGGFTLRAFAARLPVVFLHLVNAFQSGCVFRNRQAGTDAEAVDRRLFGRSIVRARIHRDCRWRRCGCL